MTLDWYGDMMSLGVEMAGPLCACQYGACDLHPPEEPTFPTEAPMVERLQRRCVQPDCEPCLVLAQAWAWRMSDMTHDTSAQSHADSCADADALRSAMREEGYSALGLAPGAGIWKAIRLGQQHVAYRRSRLWASVARAACPGLVEVGR